MLEEYINKHENSIPKEACGKYKFIWAWGKLMTSMDYYIAQQVKEAEKDGADERAIYKQDDGTWATVDECAPSTKEEVAKVLGE